MTRSTTVAGRNRSSPRPDRSEELRDLRLCEEDVRDSERALQRQPRSNEVAALSEGGVAVEDDDRGDDHEGHPAGPAGDVAARGRAIAVGRGLIAGGGSARREHPARDPGEFVRPSEPDHGVQAKQRDHRGGEDLRRQPPLEPPRECGVPNGEEHGCNGERELGGDAENELRRRLAVALLEHAGRRKAVHREDRGHAREPESDQERAVVTDAERRTGDEKGDDRRNDGNVRRDDEVLDPNGDWLVARWIAEVPREQGRGQERRDHHRKRADRRRPHAGMLVVQPV